LYKGRHWGFLGPSRPFCQLLALVERWRVDLSHIKNLNLSAKAPLRSAVAILLENDQGFATMALGETTDRG